MGMGGRVYATNDPDYRAKVHRDTEHFRAFAAWEREGKRLARAASAVSGLTGWTAAWASYEESTPMPDVGPLEERHRATCSAAHCMACTEWKGRPSPKLTGGRTAPAVKP